jgi:chromosomal replication initiation ATPase DnaA
MKAGEDWEKGKKRKIPLAQLIGKVASHLGLKEASIISSSRKRRISEARGIICYLAVNDMGYSVSEVAHALEVRRVSAGQCVIRGEKILDKNRDLKFKLIN